LPKRDKEVTWQRGAAADRSVISDSYECSAGQGETSEGKEGIRKGRVSRPFWSSDHATRKMPERH